MMHTVNEGERPNYFFWCSCKILFLHYIPFSEQVCFVVQVEYYFLVERNIQNLFRTLVVLSRNLAFIIFEEKQAVSLKSNPKREETMETLNIKQ